MRDGTALVEEVDWEVEEGDRWVVLGPNGAGKTTAVRILGTLLRPDAGHATVGGYDVVRDAGKVRGLVMRQVGLLTAVGGTVGLVGALALGYGARSLLFGLQGHDPVVFVLATIVLATVAMCAGYIPALKASKTDPMAALRYE